jgi:hypothetical protein
VADTTQVNAPTLALPAHELVQLARGLAYSFWGLLALWTAGLQTVLASAEWLTGLFGLFGAIGVLAGAWALTQAPSIGPTWRRHTGSLLVLGVLSAYLSPFAWMWRQVPTSAYFLAHALAWWWGALAYLVVLNVCLRSLARASGDRGLVWQATGVGGAAYLLLVGPYTVVVLELTEAAQRHGDSLVVVQFLLTHIHPVALFALLTPLALTLSLVWSVKDWAFRRLTTPGAPSIVEPPRT